MTTEPADPIRVLVVDDDERQLRILFRALEGFEVITAMSADAAVEALDAHHFSAAVIDVVLPGPMDGLALAARIKQRDPDLPIILLTAIGDLQGAIQAVALGAELYLVKPVNHSELQAAIRKSSGLYRIAKLRRQLSDRMASEIEMRNAELVALAHVSEQIWMATQPIVSVGARTVVAYEALLRTPTMGPNAVLDMAYRLGKVDDLGRMVRAKVADIMRDHADVRMFVNLHPHELLDDELYSPAAPLSDFATRVVLEITERASLEQVADLRGRLDRLRVMGYAIALDDLGAGYSGLSNLVRLEPEVIKLDGSLVQGITDRTRQLVLVRAIVETAAKQGIVAIAECIETAAERDALVGVGVDIQQGFFYAKPGHPFPMVHW